MEVLTFIPGTKPELIKSLSEPLSKYYTKPKWFDMAMEPQCFTLLTKLLLHYNKLEF